MEQATIQKIINIEKHPNADTLDIATVLGWRCVVKSGDFKKGDFCVYITVDSIVPDRPGFEFLRNKQFRVRSMKLRGQISQGLCIPMSILPQGEEIYRRKTSGGSITLLDLDSKNLVEGDSVAALLEITKYEKPIPACISGQVAGIFPEHISKTDEERIQNVPFILSRIGWEEEIYVSVKHDGSSATYWMDHDLKLHACSRSWELKRVAGNTIWRLAEKYDLEGCMEAGMILQAEVVGEGIQKNREGLKGHDLRAFNFIDYDRGDLGYSGLKAFCAKSSVPTADLYYLGPMKDEWRTLEGVLEEADKARYKNGAQAEGLVWRGMNQTFVPEIGKALSFKTISNKYAVKNRE